MGTIAISFCNQTDRSQPLLAVLDDLSGDRWIPDFDRREFSSACGLAADDEHLYCAIARYDSASCAIAVFDRGSYEHRDIFELPGVVDIHSICVDGGDFIVVSTGTDQIVSVDRSGTSRILWSASTFETDTHHLNAVHYHGSNLLCSAFGPRYGATWADAVDGYIYDISADRVVAHGLYQPHSLTTSDTTLYFCESGNNLVRSLETSIRYTNGYTRGLAMLDDGRYAVGSSFGRQAAPFRGPIHNAADPGEPAGSCVLEIGTLGRVAALTIDCGDIAREIYDILPIE